MIEQTKNPNGNLSSSHQKHTDASDTCTPNAVFLEIVGVYIFLIFFSVPSMLALSASACHLLLFPDVCCSSVDSHHLIYTRMKPDSLGTAAATGSVCQQA